MSTPMNEPLKTAAVITRPGQPIENPGPQLSVGEQGAVALADLGVMERIVGTANFLPVSFLEEGARVQRAVGRVVLQDGSALGTGSLVAGSLLLTNNHVLPTAAFARTTRVEFNHQTDLRGIQLASDVYTFDPSSLFITSTRLDYSLVRVRCKRMTLVEANELEYIPNPDDPRPPMPGRPLDPGVPLLLPRRTLPAIDFPLVCAGSRWGSLRLPSGMRTYASDQLVNIIQHPAGRPKEVALQDNRIVKVFAEVIRYETDTEPGSSGSPVFDNGWKIIALHHSGGDRAPSDPSGNTWLNNEGIRIDAIVKDLLSQLAQLPGGDKVRNELGI